MNNIKSKLIFEFDNNNDLLKHVNHLSELEKIHDLINKPEPLLFDNRGKHIKNLHEQTKLYQLEHPEIKYHDCMREITKLNKEPITDTS